LAIRHLEPGDAVRVLLAGLALERQVHGALARAHPQPRHGVHDGPQAIVALEAVVPALGPVAVEVREEAPPPRPLQHRLDLAGERAGLRHGPLRKQARVHQDVGALHVHERPAAQPVDELVAIGRGEHVPEGVARARLLDPLGHAQQVQVVVAQHGDRGVPERLHEAQAAERIGAAVHHVAHEPEAVARRVEGERLDEPLERREAPLQVADRVKGHGSWKQEGDGSKEPSPFSGVAGETRYFEPATM